MPYYLDSPFSDTARRDTPDVLPENGVYPDEDIDYTSRQYLATTRFVSKWESDAVRIAEEQRWAALAGPVKIIRPAKGE